MGRGEHKRKRKEGRKEVQEEFMKGGQRGGDVAHTFFLNRKKQEASKEEEETLGCHGPLSLSLFLCGFSLSHKFSHRSESIHFNGKYFSLWSPNSSRDG